MSLCLFFCVERLHLLRLPAVRALLLRRSRLHSDRSPQSPTKALEQRLAAPFLFSKPPFLCLCFRLGSQDTFPPGSAPFFRITSSKPSSLASRVAE